MIKKEIHYYSWHTENDIQMYNLGFSSQKPNVSLPLPSNTVMDFLNSINIIDARVEQLRVLDMQSTRP